MATRPPRRFAPRSVDELRPRLPIRLSLQVALLAGLLTAIDAGAIPRSAAAKAEFKRVEACPATGKSRGACPGYVIDHVIPLACGGLDHPSNMQWQTTAEAKAKDRWERVGCRP